MVKLSNISTADKILYLLIFLLFFIIIAISVVFYIKDWNQNLQYVKMEVRRAGNAAEAKHWKRELKFVYWSLVPGLTVKRIKKFYRFFKKGKRQ